MFQFQVLSLFLCMTSGLTSFSNNETKTVIPSKFSESIHAIPKPFTEKEISTNYAANTTQGIVTEIERPIVVAEGIHIFPEKQITSSREGVTKERKADSFARKNVDFKVKVTSKETEPTSYVQDNNNSDSISDSRKGITKERNANPSIVPRKGVDSEIKVMPKERIELTSYVPDSENSDSNSDKHLTNVNDFKTSTDLSTVSTISYSDNQKLNVTDSVSRMNSNITHLDLSTNVSNVTTPTSKFVLEDKKSNSTSSVSIQPHKKHKPKPTVTIGEYDDDRPIPASPTKNSPLGIPRKLDYIVPVMITIMAVPLLGIGAFVLYRRGKDCWDKRHYRRMDFLIDGMYND